MWGVGRVTLRIKNPPTFRWGLVLVFLTYGGGGTGCGDGAAFGVYWVGEIRETPSTGLGAKIYEITALHSQWGGSFFRVVGVRAEG